LKSIAEETVEILQHFGVEESAYTGGDFAVRTPITCEIIGRIPAVSPADVDARIKAAHESFLAWRNIPAPKRGEFVLHFADVLLREKEKVGRLVTIEAGKIVSEGLGEVQEMIDICIFAAGLSRQLCGLTIATERPNHRMMETWHPLGVTGIISAFNFPVAVWAWNAALALVCGNSIVWKPSEKTPLTALASQALFKRAAEEFGGIPEHLSSVLIGGREIGEALVENARVPLVSATGSTAMGRLVGPRLAKRFARSILELGGNNAAIICPSADLNLTVRAVAFAAMGTAGQRCTTLRRLIVHEDAYDRLNRRSARFGHAGRPIDRWTSL
jgi:aldehyde dehydrogenase (NAD+)